MGNFIARRRVSARTAHLPIMRVWPTNCCPFVPGKARTVVRPTSGDRGRCVAANCASSTSDARNSRRRCTALREVAGMGCVNMKNCRRCAPRPISFDGPGAHIDRSTLHQVSRCFCSSGSPSTRRPRSRSGWGLHCRRCRWQRACRPRTRTDR